MPMTYYAVFESEPDDPNYGIALSVMRFEPGITERYDSDTSAWVHYPEMLLSATGLGGASDVLPVTEEFAMSAIEAWRSGDKPPNVLETIPPEQRG